MPNAEDAATLQAHLQAVDHTAREAEAKWGFERLPKLVTPDLHARFLRQADKWSTAMGEAWAKDMLTREQLDRAVSASAAMQRAWQALDTAAEEAGHRSIQADVWEAVLADGTVVAIVRTHAEVTKVLADGRHVVVYALPEIANLLDALPTLLTQAKQVFPGVKVERRDRSWAKGRGDEIPF